MFIVPLIFIAREILMVPLLNSNSLLERWNPLMLSEKYMYMYLTTCNTCGVMDIFILIFFIYKSLYFHCFMLLSIVVFYFSFWMHREFTTLLITLKFVNYMYIVQVQYCKTCTYMYMYSIIHVTCRLLITH